MSAALDNPQRKVLRAWATREAADFMQFPSEVAVTLAEVTDLARLVPPDAPHQGVVIEVEPLEEAWLDELVGQGGRKLLVLDQVTDPHNVGAILRSAAAFGAVGDRHPGPAFAAGKRGRREGRIGRLGASAVDSCRKPRSRARRDRRGGLLAYRSRGRRRYGPARSLGSPQVALVLGAEGAGLRPNTRDHCDALARLPISDAIESLNVSNAAAVALYAASMADGPYKREHP